jgi:divalent metal cation (Fe/Co/Zn/Cd) transporter
LFLGAYVAYDSINSLIWKESPEASCLGVGITFLSLIVMPILAKSKRVVARQMNSRALEAVSGKRTFAFIYRRSRFLVSV